MSLPQRSSDVFIDAYKVSWVEFTKAVLALGDTAKSQVCVCARSRSCLIGEKPGRMSRDPTLGVSRWITKKRVRKQTMNIMKSAAKSEAKSAVQQCVEKNVDVSSVNLGEKLNALFFSQLSHSGHRHSSLHHRDLPVRCWSLWIVCDSGHTGGIDILISVAYVG